MPLLVAFVVLAAFTYSSGLRAPASIAIVKDILIYVTALAAIIVIPIELGGFHKIFAAVPAQKPERLIAIMGSDKKTRGGKLRFVLPDRLGHVETVSDIPVEMVRGVLANLAAMNFAALPTVNS